nr:hypothetical protein [Pandoravirus aubagnensis]
MRRPPWTDVPASALRMRTPVWPRCTRNCFGLPGCATAKINCPRPTQKGLFFSLKNIFFLVAPLCPAFDCILLSAERAAKRARRVYDDIVARGLFFSWVSFSFLFPFF